MSSKKKTLLPVSVTVETPETPAVPTSTASRFAPVSKGSGSGFAPRVPGFLGYGLGTGTEALALGLSDPEGVTKADLIARYVSVTGKTEKAAKSSLSVFLSDSVRPLGRYYASRSLVLETDGNTFRFSPESIALSSAAIEAGALEALRTIPEKERIESSPKFLAFLERFNLGFSKAE